MEAILPAGHKQAEISVCPVVVVTVFTGQDIQVEIEVAPIVAEYVLMPQSVQTEAPAAEYLPAPQLEHAFHVAELNEVNTPARVHM
jgi:hypothetical protein